MDVMDNEFDGNHVVSAAWHYDVCVDHGWRDVVVERRLHHSRVLLQHSVQVSASLTDVSLQSACESHIGVRVHEYLHVQQLDKT